jgi:hypothetical protein
MKFNWLKKILSVSTLGLSVCGILLTSSSSVYSQRLPEVVSFRSSNFPDRYIRHRNFLVYLEPISDELGRKDASFKPVPGLAHSRCTSFESINFPGHFLRHENFRLKLSRRTNETLFRKDATFCLVTGLYENDNTWSFGSFNFPRYYIRHKNFELLLEEGTGTNQFGRDSGFHMIPALYR